MKTPCKFLLILFLICSFKSFAQVGYGDDCNSPFDLSNKADTCTPNVTTVTGRGWYSFTGMLPSVTFKLTNSGSAAYYSKMTLYKGVCGSLTPIDSTFLLSGDSVMTLTESYLPVGVVYFIQAEMGSVLSISSSVTSHSCLKQEGGSPFCGFDFSNTSNQSISPSYSIQMSQQDQYIFNYVHSHSTIAGPFTIPVVIHVIHFGDAYGTGDNISYDQILWQIAAMNAAYQHDYAAYNQQTYGHQYYANGLLDYSSDPQVHFCLATIGRDSLMNRVPFFYNVANGDTESGVMRYDLTQTPYNSISNVGTLNEYNIVNPADEQALIDVTRPTTEFPNGMYFNIYIVPDMCEGTNCNNQTDSIPSIVGVGQMMPSPFAGLDGVVFRSGEFGDNSVIGNNFPLFPPLNQGKIMDHEAGHYLGLYHTFQPDSGFNNLACYGTSSALATSNQCDRHGDFCCDTPPDTNGLVQPYQSVSFLNTCHEVYFTINGADHRDMNENYMDYSDDEYYNTYTFDQSMRISAMLDTMGPRHSLVTPINLLQTGVSVTGHCNCCVLAANISPQNARTCPNSTVHFFTPSGTGLCATSWLWNFPGGSPSTATGTSPSVSWSASGTYTITLTATDGVNSITDSAIVTVVVPTVAITATNTTLTVCDSTKQNVYLHFTGNLPPYNVTICDESNNIVATMNNIHPDTAIVLVPVSLAHHIFHICSATDSLGCPLDTTGSGTWGFNVQTCCPNLFVDGDFENHGAGCNISPARTQQLTSAGCNTYSPTHYSIHNASVAYGGFPAVAGNNGNNGLSMFNDCWPNPQTFSPSPPHVEMWKDSINIVNGTTYSFQFDYSGNYGSFYAAQPSPPTLVLVLQLKVDGAFVGSPIIVPSGSPSTPWHTFVVDWVATIPTGLHQFAICQTNDPSIPNFHFSIGSFDYLLDNITLRSKDIPVAYAGIDTLLCSGNCVALGGVLDSNAIYLWSPSSGLSCDTCASTTACPSASTNYSLMVSENGCVVFDMVVVNISNLNVTAGGNLATCNGQLVTLTATVTGGSGNYIYLWSPGSFTTQSITVNPSSATTYTVIVRDSLVNCGNDTAMVTVTPDTISVSVSNITACIGNASSLTAVVTGGNPVIMYHWYPGNQTTSSIFVPPLTATYTVVVTDASGCSDTAQATVTPASPPSVTISASPNPACYGADVQLTTTVTGNPSFTYSWSPSTNLTSTTISNPVILAYTGVPPTYTVIVTDTNGCKSSASISVSIDTNCCLAQFYAPDTLSSNRSGGSMAVNQNMVISGNVTIDSVDVRIASNLSITVLNGSTLHITNISHLHACQNMWKGIVVQPNATLVIDSSSLVEDAFNAVQIVNATSSNVTLKQAIFNKNQIAVLAQTFAGTLNFTMKNCRVTCRSLPAYPTVSLLTAAYLTGRPQVTMIAPLNTQRSFSGVSVANGGNINIGTLSGNQNIFDYLDHGILLTNVDANIRNNRFQNMLGCGFFNCPTTTGIAIQATDPTLVVGNNTTYNTLLVGGSVAGANTFVDCYRSVDVTKYVRTTITYNSINSAATVISPSTAGLNGDHGIFIRTTFSQLMDVTNNTIKNQATGIHVLLSHGAIPFKTVNLNLNVITAGTSSTTFTNEGILAETFSNATFQPNNKLYIQQDTVKQAFTCIHVRNLRSCVDIESNDELLIRPNASAVAGVNQAGILVQNCPTAIVSGNKHTHSTGTLYSNVNHVNIRGIYIVKSQATTVTCNTVVNTGSSIVFEGYCVSSTFQQNTMKNAYYGFVMRNNAIIGTQGDTTHPIDDKWQGTFTYSATFTDNTTNVNINSPIWVRNALVYNPPSNGTNIFLAQYIPHHVGSVYVAPQPCPSNCCSQISSLALNPVREKIAHNQIAYTTDTTENRLVNQKHLLVDLHESPVLMVGDTTLQNFNSNNQISSIGMMVAVDEQIEQDNAIAAINSNAGISTSTTIEYNQRLFNDIYLNTFMQGNDSLSAQQISDLMSIAQQCPDRGGDAVWQARGMLNWVLHTSLLFTDSCVFANARISSNESRSNGVAKVFPNPNAGTFTLQYHLDSTTKAFFKVVDLTGRVIYSTPIETKVSMKQIDLGELSSGAYIYMLIGDDELKANGTLIITR